MIRPLRAVRRVLGSALALTLAVAALLGASGPARAATTTAEGGRVVFLGFDGADGRTARALMDAGQLPNLAKLAETGHFAPLGTTNPAESPVSWASLNSGRNPAETGVVGFLRRENSGSGPMPIKGFAKDGVPVPLGELELPGVTGWFVSAGRTPVEQGLLLGGIALVGFGAVFGLLLRLKALPSLLLSLVLAGFGYYAGSRMRGDLPDSFPVVQNLNVAAPFWELAADAGVDSIVLDAAQAWNRVPVSGTNVLCGLGVPDARGDYISYFIYTTDELYAVTDPGDSKASTGTGGLKLRVDERDGKIAGAIVGPVNFVRVQRIEEQIAALQEEKSTASNFEDSKRLNDEIKALEAELKEAKQPMTVELEVVRGDGTAEVSIAGHAQTLAEGAWSDWYRMTFKLNSLIEVHAITRVKLVHLDEPYFELFVNAIEIDPEHPPFWQPISQPPEFSKELVEIHGGPFETVGWSCLTHPFKDDIIDAAAFMEDIEFTMKWRESLTMKLFDRGDWRLFVSLFSTPDRVQHMMYQYYDEGHPMYDAEEASRTMTFFGEVIEFRDAIPAIYRQVDRIVGEVVARLGPEDTLLIGADHGFQSFRRQVHINNWLAQNGYLALKPGVSKSQASMPIFYADWSETRAYAMGLGTVYLNLKGREQNGIVEPAEADALMREIREKLLQLEDPDFPGAPVVSEVYFAKDVHSGEFLKDDADMFFCFAPNYRVSWGTSLGGISLVKSPEDGTYGAGPVVVDNDKNWSGGHVSVDPEHVKGMFFSSRPIVEPEGGVDLLHIAPTVLALLGLERPAEMDVPALATR